MASIELVEQRPLERHDRRRAGSRGEHVHRDRTVAFEGARVTQRGNAARDEALPVAYMAQNLFQQAERGYEAQEYHRPAWGGNDGLLAKPPRRRLVEKRLQRAAFFDAAHDDGVQMSAIGRCAESVELRLATDDQVEDLERPETIHHGLAVFRVHVVQAIEDDDEQLAHMIERRKRARCLPGFRNEPRILPPHH